MTYAWLENAYADIGLEEIPGPKHEPRILAFWKDIKRGGIKDDETPWCSAACGAWFEKAGIQSPRFEGALSWLKWGVPLPQPVVGCVVVFKRKGGGHVGLVVGKDARGYLMVLGGNQKNMVRIDPFEMDRVEGYRWPSTVPLPPFAQLPFVASTDAPSRNEA